MKGRVAIVAAVLAAGCSGQAPPTTTGVVIAASTPEEVFAVVVDALVSGEVDGASAATDRTQIALLAIAEGLGSRQVSELEVADLDVVAANFWSGFSEQLASTLGSGMTGLRMGEVARTTVGGSEFAVAALQLPGDGASPRLVLRSTQDGWVVDLIASFPSPLLERVPDAADKVRASGDPDLRQDLAGWEDSILFLLDDRESAPQLNQLGIAALEAIGR